MKDLEKGDKRYYDHKNEYEECFFYFDNVYYIGQYTFYNFDHLKTITFRENKNNENYLNEIGEHAFEGCALLETITFEGNPTLTKIDAYAFAGCTSLTTITIPSSVTYIGEHAFDGCTNLTTVIFEGEPRLETIGNYAFKDCAKLTDFTIPRSVNSVGAQTFDKSATLNTEYGIDHRSMVINSSLNYRLYSNNAPADSYVIFNNEFKAVAESGGTYACCYQLTALAPQLLTETITATLYVYGGMAKRIEFKVIDYLVEILEKYEYYNVAIDLIEYGAASQMYTHYKTDDLAMHSCSYKKTGKLIESEGARVIELNDMEALVKNNIKG